MELIQIALLLLYPIILPSYGAAEVIKVSTRHYEPFMYGTSNGSFVNGIEFQLIKTIAGKLNTAVELRHSPQQFDQMNLT